MKELSEKELERLRKDIAQDVNRYIPFVSNEWLRKQILHQYTIEEAFELVQKNDEHRT